MFMLNGQPLALDTPFTTGDIQYPANWLRLASPEERAAIGITEADDPQPYDDRFYWGPGNPKALDDVTETIDGVDYTTKGLKSQMIAQVKATAGSLLAPSDWMVLRQLSRGVGMSHIYEDYRNAVIEYSNTAEAVITACTSVDELAAVQFEWPTI